jgi:hypothetical protein
MSFLLFFHLFFLSFLLFQLTFPSLFAALNIPTNHASLTARPPLLSAHSNGGTRTRCGRTVIRSRRTSRSRSGGRRRTMCGLVRLISRGGLSWGRFSTGAFALSYVSLSFLSLTCSLPLRSSAFFRPPSHSFSFSVSHSHSSLLP